MTCPVLSISKLFLRFHYDVAIYFETDVMQNSALSVNKVEVEVEVQGFSLPLFEFLSVWNVKCAYFISCFRHFHACLQKFCITFKWSVSFE